MKPNEIVAELKRLNIKQKDIAEDLGVFITAVNNTIYGRNKSRRIQSAIAQILDLPFDDVWPPSSMEKYTK